MSNYEQRILKFLNQNMDLNPDRSPTITDMMTKLNISISDISDSLKNLLAQGLVSRRMNSIGIECWSPQPVSQPPAQPVPPSNNAVASKPVVSPAVNFMGGPIDKPLSRPEVVPNTPKAGPVPVQHFSLIDKAALETQTFPAMSLTQPKIEKPAQQFAPPPPFNSQIKTTSAGVNILTLVIGILIAIGLSVAISITLIASRIEKLQIAMADDKTASSNAVAMTEFQSKTKSHISELENQVELLKLQITALSILSDSIKSEDPVTEIKPVITKSPPVIPKPKVTKKVAPPKPVKPTKPIKTPPALTKPAPTKIKKEKVGPSKNPNPVKSEQNSTSYDPESSTSPIESPSSSSYDAGPSVPTPPGLDNQDLPPPSP